MLINNGFFSNEYSINNHLNHEIMEGVHINNHEAGIYFSRHAETLANIGTRTVDSPLSQNGISQLMRCSTATS